MLSAAREIAARTCKAATGLPIVSSHARSPGSCSLFRKITIAEGKQPGVWSVTTKDDRESHADQCSRAERPHTVSTGPPGEDPVGAGLATAPALLVLRGPLARARAAGPGHRPHPRRRLAHGARRPVEPAVLRRAAREELRGIRQPAGSVRRAGGSVHRDRRLRALLHPDAADSLAALAHRTIFPRLARGTRLLLAPARTVERGEPRTAHPGRHRYRHQPDPGSADRCHQFRGDPGIFRGAAVDPVRHAAPAASGRFGRDPGLHGVGGHPLRGAGVGRDSLRRAGADRDQLRPSTLRRGVPVSHDPHTRKRGRRRALRRGSGRRAATEGGVREHLADLVAVDEGAAPAHLLLGWLWPGGNGIPDHRRGTTLLRGRTYPRRTDADRAGVRRSNRR